MKRYFIYILASLLFWSCTKKEMDFDVIQDLCKQLTISKPSYSVLADGCDSTSTFASFEIGFNYDGAQECVHAIVSQPKFYNSKNEEITGINFNEKTIKPDFTITDDSVTYWFDLTFESLEQALSLNHVILDFYTENEIENPSNTLQIRLNTTCSTVDPSTYDVNSNSVDIPSSQQLFNIILWDNAAEDGDIVSVYLNEQWIIENHTLLNDSTVFNFSTDLLYSGENDLVVFALNEGTSGPNTVSIAVNGKEIPNFKPGLLTGEAVRIDF